MRTADEIEAKWGAKQRQRWATHRAKTGRARSLRIPRAVWGDAVDVRVPEAPYPRGFELDHDAFAVAYRAFWEPRP